MTSSARDGDRPPEPRAAATTAPAIRRAADERPQDAGPKGTAAKRDPKKEQGKEKERKERTRGGNARRRGAKKGGAKRARSRPTDPASARTADEDAAAEEATESADGEVIVLAIRGMVLFPNVVLPVVIGRQRSVQAIQAAVQEQRPVVLLLQQDPEDDDPAPEELHSVGTVAGVVRYLTAPDGSHHAIVQGQSRCRVLEFLQREPFPTARVERVPEDTSVPSKQIEARFLSLRQQALDALELLPEKPGDLEQAIQSAGSPSQLADLVATFMEIEPGEKQEILEAFDLRQRLELVGTRLSRLSEVLKLSSDIREQTHDTLTRSQREYYLREQLRTIQAELGEGQSVEIAELRERIEQSGMPEEALTEARKELTRLERMPEAAAEHGMVRSYLDWLLELPWRDESEDRLDVKNARKILDEDHFGLERVKKRIIEFLAVRKLKPDGKSPILCLVGPPGVGKTSLGRSIARAMGRKFVRVSLGGVHDESEIRGHRRTYVGSMPGNVIQQIRRAGTRNPVFLLDEMDKLGTGFHGDPASALLEVLDPEQNNTFRDHYLNVPFDLSRVMFLATANVKDGIPGPLRDRCEVIEISGYTETEKLEIAKRYLVDRQLEANGLKQRQLAFRDDALRALIRSYTREAGCRNLEREIGAVARNIATRIATGEIKSKTVRAKDVREILGAPRYESEIALRTSVPGVATGLAWTPVGGELLFVEATSMPGKGESILTGQLGDVMKESARAAVTLVKSKAVDLGIDPAAFQKQDLHVHVPAGAIPKDGPSAGVALYTALVSLFTARTVKSNVAMTGEISLRGLVLPVGGIKEKVLAAHRAGIRRVLLPKRNEKDVDEIPAQARKDVELVFLERVEDALEAALEKRSRKGPRRSTADAPTRLSARKG